MKKDYGKYFRRPSQQAARKRVNPSTETIDFDVNPNIENLGNGKYYMIQTYGCQGNEADSETMHGIFRALGFTSTDDAQSADVIILNTCAIRENAENRVFGELGRLKQYKKTNPNLLLGVAGCMPQEEHVVDTLLEKYPYVDLIFGTHNIHQLPAYIETAMLAKERVIEVYSEEGAIIENLPKARVYSHKAFVNIMYGCDEFCTYCVVPYTRGKERSRAKVHIVEEVRQLVEEGYKEVTLLGQNVNAYGQDLPDVETFAALLDAVADTNIARIRFTTSHPRDFDQATIDVIAKRDNIMPHIHLPVQSGNNDVLKKMNRKYTRESYLSLIEMMRKAMPNLSLTTDLIVGFPKETDAAFEDTLTLVEAAQFEGAFTFIFSAREGTPAARYEDTVSHEAKRDRLKRLNKVVNTGYLRGHKRFEGQVVKVLVDGESKNDSSMLSGYTEHHKLVNFKGSQDLIGKIVPVFIEEAKTWSMRGVLYENT